MSGYTNPLADRRTWALKGAEDFTAYPGTHQGWVDRYQYLLDAYHGETYSELQTKCLGLFRALDDDGEIIALTRRLHRDIQYIVDTAVAAIAMDRVTLQPAEGASAEDVQIAEDIWRRSCPDDAGAVWSLLLACCGDLYVEPCRADPESMDVSLVHYPPQNVYLEYDIATGRRITRAIVTSQVMGEAIVDAEGYISEAPETYVHQRILTAEDITVKARLPNSPEGEEQEQIDQRATGPHGLGRSPLVHIRCTPTIYPEHALPVTHGIERGLAEVDSLASQMSAVGDRFGNPKPYLIGAQMSAGSAWSRFGRWLNVWGSGSKDVKLGYLEPSMQGMKALQDALERLIRDIRVTFPEFLFVGGGSTANLSGEALRLLATQYESKYRGIRARMYGGLERALAMGVALQQRRPYDPTRHPVRLVGPPLLPADVKAELEALSLAKGIHGVSGVDVVRHTQRLGLVDSDVNPAEHAQLIAEETMGRASLLMGDTDPLGESSQAAGSPGLLEAAAEQLRGLLPSLPPEAREDVSEAIEAIEEALDEVDGEDLSDDPEEGGI